MGWVRRPASMVWEVWLWTRVMRMLGLETGGIELLLF
jgi:hypothetical protein